jgi:PPK2 family polyphosphate:nucleotide phosphotransferase
MDTSGKDGTVKHVMATLNPMGCQAWGFKQPTAEELAHDFLWRVHKRAPPKGVLGIFNRSHYEDVLVVRVHRLVPREVWRGRYERINNFERMLTQEGTVILKFFLHISKDEQKRRLLAREQDPDTAWKLSLADWEERAYWDAYQEAYEDALGKCGTPWAPWRIIPADHKWFRNYTVARTIVERLEPLTHQWIEELRERGRQALQELEEAHAHEKYS